MTRVDWATPGTHLFEVGVDRGMLYVDDNPGVAWPGLISVNESPTGGEVTGYYLDGRKYLQAAASSEFEATINAYMSPYEFDVCEGYVLHNGITIADQAKKPFGLSYRTLFGTELDSDEGYKIHLIYNAMAVESDRDYATITESIDPLQLSWPIQTRANPVMGFKPVAHAIIKSTDVAPDIMSQLEEILYGTVSTDPRLPLVDELFSLLDYVDGGVVGDGITDFYDGGNYDDVIPDLIDGGSL